MVLSRNLTVRAVPVEATAVAPSRANAPDQVTNELSATHRSLNSRRLSDRAGSESMRGLWLRQNEQVHARSRLSSGGLESRSRTRMLPQWHPPKWSIPLKLWSRAWMSTVREQRSTNVAFWHYPEENRP